MSEAEDVGFEILNFKARFLPAQDGRISSLSRTTRYWALLLLPPSPTLAEGALLSWTTDRKHANFELGRTGLPGLAFFQQDTLKI